MDRMDEQLPPDTIYGFGSDPYKEGVTQLQHSHRQKNGGLAISF